MGDDARQRWIDRVERELSRPPGPAEVTKEAYIEDLRAIAEMVETHLRAAQEMLRRPRKTS